MTSPDPSLFTELNRLTLLSHASDFTPSTPFDSLYTTSLHTATLDLRRQILDLELQIASLQSQSSEVNSPANDDASDTTRLRAQLSAYRTSFSLPPYLPPPNSPLNLLLAYRHILRSITQTSSSLPVLRSQLEETATDLAAAQTALNDQEQLTAALERRLEELKQPVEKSSAVAELKKKTKELGRREEEMRGFLMGFLGRLEEGLEVEELGGPVVGMGTEMEIERVVRKRTKGGQMTIKEAFRKSRPQGEEEEDQGVEGELRELLGKLLERSHEADEYVTLERESAMARFLVRAKAAEFHPRDARRIKLVDFGGGFE